MRLYVDDVRPCPEGWTLARTVDEAKRLLETEDVISVSLDHDMGACEECSRKGEHVGDMETPESTYYNWCSHAVDGYALVMWMIETNHVPPLVAVHSMNPVGKRRMIAALEARRR